MYPGDTPKDKAISIWMNEKNDVYVAEEEGEIKGTYFLCPNFSGAGSHVANASFMVSSKARGSGIGKAMAEHALDIARQKGYRSMQFNLVVSTNENAVKLWKKLGFEIVGTLPEAFKHPKKGFVDAHVMYRHL